MSWVDRLRARVDRVGAPISFGLDPNLDRISQLSSGAATTSGRVAEFFISILERMAEKRLLPAVVKPNLAYYEALGPEGLAALEQICARCHELELPVLLDAKRGDIGRSSRAYAEAAFDRWGADAVTISGYMGSDSVAPFTQWCERGRGVYVLCRTSNPGAAELQDLALDHKPLFLHVADQIAGRWYQAGIGAVVGATSLGPLGDIASALSQSGRQIPLLLPGFGAQGGSARRVAELLRRVGYDLNICLFSASSSIAYAGEEPSSGQDYAAASCRAIERLRNELGR